MHKGDHSSPASLSAFPPRVYTLPFDTSELLTQTQDSPAPKPALAKKDQLVRTHSSTMPIAITRDGHVVLLDHNRNFVHEITDDFIRACLERHAQNTQEEVERRRREQDDNNQRELEWQKREEELDVKRTEIETKCRHADDALRTLKAKTKEIERREREVTAEKRRVAMEIAVLVQKQSMDRHRLEHERVERDRLESERRDLEITVRRDMESLQRDRAELVERENIERQRLKENGHERKHLEAELQEFKEQLRLEKEQLRGVRQDLDRQNAFHEEASRKATAQLREQERIAQEIDEQCLQNTQRVEAEHAEELASQTEQWEKKLEKLGEKANKSREDGAKAIAHAKAKAAEESRNRANAERNLKEADSLRVKVEDEFTRFREEARGKLGTLVAKQSANDSATRAELERTLKDLQMKTQELQDLRAQMVEMELGKAREQARAGTDAQPKLKASSIVQHVDSLAVPKEDHSDKSSRSKRTIPTPLEDLDFTPTTSLPELFSRSKVNAETEEFDEEVDSDLMD